MCLQDLAKLKSMKIRVGIIYTSRRKQSHKSGRVSRTLTLAAPECNESAMIDGRLRKSHVRANSDTRIIARYTCTMCAHRTEMHSSSFHVTHRAPANWPRSTNATRRKIPKIRFLVRNFRADILSRRNAARRVARPPRRFCYFQIKFDFTSELARQSGGREVHHHQVCRERCVTRPGPNVKRIYTFYGYRSLAARFNDLCTLFRGSVRAL